MKLKTLETSHFSGVVVNSLSKGRHNFVKVQPAQDPSFKARQSINDTMV